MKLSTRRASATLKLLDEIEEFTKTQEGVSTEIVRAELLKRPEMAEFYKTHQHTFEAASDPASAVELSFVRSLLGLRCNVDRGTMTEKEAEEGFSIRMAEKLEKNFTEKEKAKNS